MSFRQNKMLNCWQKMKKVNNSSKTHACTFFQYAVVLVDVIGLLY